jgi:GNAT superfamily N-acetyltransferase
MKLRIERINDVPSDLLREYLRRQGWSDDLIEWKYFDDTFNAGRTRGFVWIHEGRVRGMIGMIPGLVAHDGRLWPVHWGCDWSVESPERNRGIGIVLLQEAVKRVPSYIGVGGNEHSLRYVPKLAMKTFEHVAVDYHIPLRLDAVLDKIGRRVPALGRRRWPVIGRLPVPRFRRPGGTYGFRVRTEDGVPAILDGLLTSPRATGSYFAYDSAHVSWSISRCPVISSTCTYVADGPEPSAAVIYWTTRHATRRWYATLWAREGADAALSACLAETIRQSRARGSSRLTIKVARRDDDFIRLLRREGAIAGNRSSLFLIKTDEHLAGLPEPRRLSFLDSDWTSLA